MISNMSTSSSRASQGRKFQREKNYTIDQRKNLRRLCDAQTEFFVRTSVQAFMVVMFRGGDMTRYDVMRLVVG